MYFVLPPGLPCCLLYSHLLFNATLTPLCPPIGVGVDGIPNTLSSNAASPPLPEPTLHLLPFLFPPVVARRTRPLAGLPEKDPPEPKAGLRIGLPEIGLPERLPETLRPSGELPAVANRLLVALTARGVLRAYRGGVQVPEAPGVAGVAVGGRPRSERCRGVRGISERSSFFAHGRRGRMAW
jgi:hypothetical protein